MTNRIVPALSLAIVLALPALGQSNSAAPATPADQSSSSAAGASGKQPLQYDSHEGFWGKVNPFARKKYVQRQVQPVQDRVNELDELTASNTKQIKDVDSRAQAGIQMASAK